MSAVFADAFYFVARLNRRDQYHERVVTFSRNFRARVVTTDWVLMEVADALAKSECRPRVWDFILHLRAAAGSEVVPASREVLDRARVVSSARRQGVDADGLRLICGHAGRRAERSPDAGSSF